MAPAPQTLRIGTAGWAIASQLAPQFPPVGSSLRRYSARFNAAEINSTFYKSRKPSTYQNWAASVPDDFRFSVKLPKAITHDRRLSEAEDLLARFLEEVSHLGSKLGPLLVQLPSSFEFDAIMTGRFLALLRRTFTGAVVCERPERISHSRQRGHPTARVHSGSGARSARPSARHQGCRRNWDY